MKKQCKKILVVFITIIVGGLIGGIFEYYNKKKCISNYEENISEEITNFSQNEVIQEETTEGELLENQEKMQEDDNEEEQENNTVKAQVNNYEQKDEIKMNMQMQKVDKTKEKEEVSNSENITKKEETNIVNNPTIIEEPKKEESKPIETPKQEETKQDVHTFKYNGTIVEKIRQDIMNNESEYMKQYGYNIIVDESIVTQTNQFTYTTNRVKYMVEYKFGTIKIYARDYYLNGNYMYTECYII